MASQTVTGSEAQQPAGTRRQALEVDGLTVRFGAITPVDGVSLSVRPGELVGLIGPNGAGKSTFIDAISGFAPVASGTISLGGVDITKAPAYRRARAGLVRSWQSLEIFEDVTVRENLQAAFHGLSRWEQLTGLLTPRKQALDVVELSTVEEFGLHEDMDRLPGELSFSQRRVITTARALSLDPTVVLLDEPAAGMSDTRRATLAKAIRSLARDRGIGVLLVDHDMPFVMGLCDRIVVLNFGKVICDGAPEHVRADRGVIDAYLGGEPGDERPAAPTRVTVSEREAEQAAERPVLLGARDLSVGYYGHPVVEGIDFDLRQGEIVALLGANRAGKTTTLLSLAGVNEPLRGEVHWLGERVTRRMTMRELADQGLGFLMEERAVFQQLTVAENLRVARCDPDLALTLFPELEPVVKKKAGVLSGGQQQMLGLARALAREPRVLLVDEMSLGLAPQIVSRLMQALRDAADTGIGVILVEQHVPQALRIADQVCVIAGGRMTLSGRVGDVAERVDAAFLADVLGRSTADELDQARD